ncbi:hypothetical protein DLM46_01715 [Paraburkholderia lacunae]|uniref:Uncharacterized protein n=1 Tax=Paraburkholderia lacunae TaxID=2211104 RepID=A0A370NG79_9BURK|nr:hypothetical protein DLM46_01715 [Paraburkholderia lacunae]
MNRSLEFKHQESGRLVEPGSSPRYDNVPGRCIFVKDDEFMQGAIFITVQDECRNQSAFANASRCDTAISNYRCRVL